MNRVIKYNRLVRSRAGNKNPFQTGLLLTKNDNIITVETFNSVTASPTTGLYIEIPLESVEEIIEKLKELL